MKIFRLIFLPFLLLSGSFSGLSQDPSCLTFDGSNDYISADNAALNDIGTGDFTFEAWVKGDLVGQNTHPTIFSDRPAANGTCFFFHNNWGGSLYKMLCVQLGATNYFVFNNGTYNATFFDGTCHHVAITREGSLLTFYADGVSFGTRTIAGDPSVSSVRDLWIGKDFPTNNEYEGNISQVRIWDDVRTEAEIFDNKDLSILGGEPNLVGYWELNDGTGQTAIDKTGLADGQLGSTGLVDVADPTWGADCCIEGCTALTTMVSDTEVCFGEEVTLEASSESGGIINWDGGVTNGDPFTPPIGTTTYTATSDFDGDCVFSVDITVYELPDIEANAAPSIVCLGESVTLEGSGGEIYSWDPDVEDGVSFEPLTVGITTYTVTGTDINGCQNTAEIDITILPAPTADFEFIIDGVSSEDGSTGGCILNPVQFNDLSTVVDPDLIEEWDWNFGDGTSSDEENPSHIYGAVGTYTITLTIETENGCTATYTLEITMTNGLTIDILYNEPTCYGFSDGSITISVDGGLDDLVFKITNDLDELLNEDNSNTANTLPTGWYYINVSDGSACDAVDSLFLGQPDQLDIDLIVTNPLCYGFQTGWAQVDSVYNATGDYDGISYIWSPNPSGVGGVFADSSFNLGAGAYTLTINDASGCSRTFDFSVSQPDSIYFNEFDYDPAYCRVAGYQSGNGVVYGSALGGVSPFTYEWTNLSTGTTHPNTTWGGLNPGDYELTAIDGNGCILERTITVDSLNPQADFEMTSPEFTADYKGVAPLNVHFENLSINYSNPNAPTGEPTFFWNFDVDNSSWFITHNALDEYDTTYLAKGNTYMVDVCLVAMNKNGCKDTACKIITVFEPTLFVPINVFTPNGDGINDVFSFSFKSAAISEFKCVIVNRWGVVVHELNDITEVWNGSDKNGNPYNDGTYFYNYVALTDNGLQLEGQGTVQLVVGK